METRSFSEMTKATDTNIKAMLEGFASPPEGTRLGSTQKMLGDFYASCMDEESV